MTKVFPGYTALTTKKCNVVSKKERNRQCVLMQDKIYCESLLPVANCCFQQLRLTDKRRECSDSYQFALKNHRTQFLPECV